MILAIDTSTQWMGVAVLDNNNILYEKVWKTSRRHTVELSPAIEQSFSDTGITSQDLTAIAVAQGPGSFTSLRIGLAIAKGFVFSLRIPLVAVPSLDIIARGIPSQDIELVCLLRAGRGRFACMRYINKEGIWISTGELSVITAEELEQNTKSRTLVCGEMDAEEIRVLSRRWRNIRIVEPPFNIRRPSILAYIAQERLANNDSDDVASCAPIYLRTVKNIAARTPV